jgi:hypothetical protein
MFPESRQMFPESRQMFPESRQMFPESRRICISDSLAAAVQLRIRSDPTDDGTSSRLYAIVPHS